MNTVKRAKGTGSVFKRTIHGNEVWVTEYTPIGSSKKITKYSHSQAGAKKILKELREDPLCGDKETKVKGTLGDYLEYWMVRFKRNSLKNSSYDRLERTVRCIRKDPIANNLFVEVTDAELQAYIDDQFAEGKSHSHIKKIYDALSACYKHAVIARDIYSNPMLTVNMVAQAKFAKPKRKALTKEEETALLAVLMTKQKTSNSLAYRYSPAYRLMLNTGIRPGELLALDWDDIDIDGKTLHVCKDAIYVLERDKEGKKTGKQKQIVQDTPKTTSSDRFVPLNKKAMEAIIELQQILPQSKYVIHTKNGNRVTLGILARQLRYIQKQAGIDFITLHGFRHTFATRLFERGADVKTVSKLLGHASTTITYNTYIDVISNQREEAVRLLENDLDQ